jgi:type IV pilus assembly protein PilB
MTEFEFKGNLGQLMVESGAISINQLEAANEYRGNSKKSICRVLVEFGFMEADQMQKMMSQLLDIPMIPLAEIEINPAVAHIISYSTASSCTAIPVLRFGETLLMAMDNPFNRRAIEDIKSQTELALRCVQANPQEILDQINRHFLADND